jgi:protein-tyrosine kinase
MSTGHWRSLVITGSEVQQGKTLTAINLAYALAQDPQSSVFLVDLDLRRPQMANYLGLNINKGLSDYLAGAASADEVIYETGTPRLAIVPNLNPVLHSSEALASSRMAEFDAYLRAQSPARYIIYDMPPLLMADDVMVFAPFADAVLMVVTEGVSVRSSLESSKEVLGDVNLIGTVLNRSAETSDAGGYYY